jgi:hypothetical protein
MVFSFSLGAGATYRLVHRGGYHPGPLPPAIAIAGAHPPQSFSLVPFIARVHNQGSSSSCVAQTLATIKEITVKEHRTGLHKKITGHWFSAGYIYDQVNGGVDKGATYDAAFGILQSQGDALYRAFPHDGIDYWAQPDFLAHKNAAHYKIRSFRSIDPSDRATIAYEIAHGRPVAVAMPIDNSFYDLPSTPGTLQTLGAWSPPFIFWHSLTAVAYDPIGLTLLNSWGAHYGDRGLVRITWSYLATIAWNGAGAAVVVSTPKFPTPPPGPTPTPTPEVTTTPTETVPSSQSSVISQRGGRGDWDMAEPLNRQLRTEN